MPTIDGYEFEDFYSSTDKLRNQSGVYVVICDKPDSYKIVDVGESSEIKDRIENHDRKDCWKDNCKVGTIKFAVHYTPGKTQEQRREIESKIRNSPKRTVLCGEE